MRSLMGQVLHVGTWDGIYAVLLGIGLVCLILAATMLVRWSRGERLPELHLDVAQADMEEPAFPKGTVYLDPNYVSTMRVGRQSMRLLRWIGGIGGGFVVFALFGIISNPVEQSLPLRFFGALAVGMAAGAAIYMGLPHSYANRTLSNAGTHPKLTGAMGEVTVTIPEDSLGLISVTVEGRKLSINARAEDLSALSKGTIVQVVDVVDSLALVKRYNQT
jgi:hypothetical protein